MSKLISRAADCNISKFMACKFDNDLEVLIIKGQPLGQELFEAWDNIHTEYIDLSGTNIAELNILKEIKKLECRNEAVAAYLLCTKVGLEGINNPFPPELPELPIALKRNGINLKWNNDAEDFRRQLKKAELSETKYKTALNSKLKELETYREHQSGKSTIDNSRVEFIRLLNNLQKDPFYYRIDKEKTSVEEFAVMVHDYTKACEKLAKKSNAA